MYTQLYSYIHIHDMFVTESSTWKVDDLGWFQHAESPRADDEQAGHVCEQKRWRSMAVSDSEMICKAYLSQSSLQDTSVDSAILKET